MSPSHRHLIRKGTVGPATGCLGKVNSGLFSLRGPGNSFEVANLEDLKIRRQ